MNKSNIPRRKGGEESEQKEGRKLLFDDRGSKMSEDEGFGTSTKSSRTSSTRTEKDGTDTGGGGDSSLVLDFAGFRRDRHGAVKKKQVEIVKGHR